MGKVQTKLRLMNGGGVSPGAEEVHVLSDGDSTTEAYIVHAVGGRYLVCEDLSEYESGEIDVLAKLTKRRQQ